MGNLAKQLEKDKSKTTEKMEQRIAQFDIIWSNIRILPPPPLIRYEFVDRPLKPILRRQTNEHELLPTELRVRWWDAHTAEDKDAILMEYEATTW